MKHLQILMEILPTIIELHGVLKVGFISSGAISWIGTSAIEVFVSSSPQITWCFSLLLRLAGTTYFLEDEIILFVGAAASLSLQWISAAQAQMVQPIAQSVVTVGRLLTFHLLNFRLDLKPMTCGTAWIPQYLMLHDFAKVTVDAEANLDEGDICPSSFYLLARDR